MIGLATSMAVCGGTEPGLRGAHGPEAAHNENPKISEASQKSQEVRGPGQKSQDIRGARVRRRGRKSTPEAPPVRVFAVAPPADVLIKAGGGRPVCVLAGTGLRCACSQ